MKKITILFTLFVLIAALTTSCNKKKLDELEADLAATQADLDAAKAANNNSINNINGMLQAGNPINVSVQGNRRYDSTAFSYNSSFDFMWRENYYENYVEAQGDGTYDFWIQRYATVSGYLYAYIWIQGYDPAIGMSSASYEFYFEDRYAQSDTTANLFLDTYGDDGVANNVTVNSINYNPATHAFSVNATVNTVENSSYSSTFNPTTATFSYSGTLTPYTTVYKKSAN